jgi:hypothetical protein
MVREHWRDISLLAESLGIESRNWGWPPWEDKWNGLAHIIVRSRKEKFWPSFHLVEHDVGEICIGESIGQLIIANTDNLT